MKAALSLSVVVGTFTGLVALIGCQGSPPLEAGVPLKRGTSIRVITVSDGDWTAKFGDRPAHVFPVSKGEVAYTLVPPSVKELVVTGNGTTKTIPVSLEAGKSYTYVCIPEGSQIVIQQLKGDVVKPVANTQVQVLNFADAPFTSNLPEMKSPVAPNSASEIVTNSDAKLDINGKLGEEKVQSVKSPTRVGTVYAALVYRLNGKPKISIMDANPPTRAAGMSQ